MNSDDAEEYTQALGQVVSGGWRQVALGERLGVPEALGLSTRDWVEGRLGGYVRLSAPERREAVAELTANGMTQREVADVLGVGRGTVARDSSAPNGADDQVEGSATAPNGADAEALLERAAEVADLIETVKTERRPKATAGEPAHPAAAFLWARLSEVRALDVSDASPEQRPDIAEALGLWLGELDRLQLEVTPT